METHTAAYFQDDWKITGRLTLNLGIRYDLNTRCMTSAATVPHSTLRPAKFWPGSQLNTPPLATKNFAPRLGFAYDLSGKQTTVIRGGYGIFFSPIVGGGGNPLNGVSKFPFEFTSTGTSPNGITPASTLAQGPVILPQFSLDDPKLGFGGNVAAQAPNTAPYVEQWNIGVEHTIASSLVLGVSYVGSGGHKWDTGRLNYINMNQVPYPVAQQAGVAQGTLNPNTANLRPYPNFNYVELLNPRYGNSSYNSLQLKLEQHLPRRCEFP